MGRGTEMMASGFDNAQAIPIGHNIILAYVCLLASCLGFYIFELKVSIEPGLETTSDFQSHILLLIIYPEHNAHHILTSSAA